jgi:hypothetical protein
MKNIILKTGTGHYYVDNDRLLILVNEYQETWKKFENGFLKKPPNPPKEIMGMIDKIIRRELNKPKYRSYTYHDDMYSTALFDCFRSLLLFDSSKSKYIFSYLWRSVLRAFVRVTYSEKRQTNIKSRLMLNKLDEILNNPEIEDSVVTRLMESSGFEHYFQDVAEPKPKKRFGSKKPQSRMLKFFRVDKVTS